MTQVLSVAEYRLLVARAPDRAGRRKSKYGAKPCVVDGHRFPSHLEANRYGCLKLLMRSGAIRDLRLQVRFPLEFDGVAVATYVADFVYQELLGGAWRQVVEDTKGFATQVYKLKKRLFLQAYPHIDFREIK